MQIDLGKLVQEYRTAEQQLGADVMKAFGLSGSGFDNFALMDIFGAPGHSAVGTSAMRDIEQVRGWNFTAILAKALQFGLGSMAVYCPQWIAEAICDQHGIEYKASKRVTGTEQYGVPEDWVTAPAQHRIAALLKSPNPWRDEATFLFEIAEQTNIHGVAHILVLPNAAGMPKELWVIPKAAIQPVAPSAMFPEGSYRIGHLSKLSINTQVDDQPLSLQQALARISNREYSAKYIIPIGLPSPLFVDDFLNSSSAISDTVDTDAVIHRTRRNMLEKLMTTGPRLEPMPGVTVSNSEWVKLIEEFESQNLGPNNQGNAWRPPSGIKVTNDSHTGREMEFVQSADQSRDHTLGQHLLSSAMLGLGAGGSYAQVVGLIKGNARLILQPLMRIYSGQLTIGLRRFMESPQNQFMALLQAANIDDPEQRRSEWDLLMKAKAVKVKEVREAFNMMPLGSDEDDKMAGEDQAAGMGGYDNYGYETDPGYAPQGQTNSGQPETPGIGAPEAPAESTESLKNTGGTEAPSLGKMSRREFMRHSKNISDIVEKFRDGKFGEKTAHLMLQTLGLSKDMAQEFVDSVKDPRAEQSMSHSENQTTASALFSRAVQIRSGAFTSKSLIDDQARTAATHPDNMLRIPCEKDLKAGIYRKGRLKLCGLMIEIENPAGSVRSGRRPDGSRWAVEMQDHYGYIVGAVGFDKDQLDVFIKTGTEPDFDGMIYVINQANADGSFDEHKCFMGCASKSEAIKRYLDNYDDDWSDRIMSVAPLPVARFKEWLIDPDGGPMAGPLHPQDALKYMTLLIEPGPAGSVFERAMSIKAAKPPVSMKDGDGDGLIFDGTSSERPANARTSDKQKLADHMRSVFGTTVQANGLPVPSANDEFRDNWLKVASEYQIKLGTENIQKIEAELREVQSRAAIKPNSQQVIVNRGTHDIDDAWMRIDQVNQAKRDRKIRALRRDIDEQRRAIEGAEDNLLLATTRLQNYGKSATWDEANQVAGGMPEMDAEQKQNFLDFLLGKGFAFQNSDGEFGGQFSKSVDSEAMPADLGDTDEDDPQEKAELIADILVSLYGDETESLLDDGEDFDKLAGAFAKAFNGGGMFKEATTRRRSRRAAPGVDPRDGDGDGVIFDGTSREQPAGARPERRGGRRPKNSPEQIAQIHADVQSALKGERSAKSAKQLAESLSTLTVKQLRDIKLKYELKASGRTKQELVDKIAKRLDAGRRADQSPSTIVERQAAATRSSVQSIQVEPNAVRDGNVDGMRSRRDALRASAAENAAVAQDMAAIGRTTPAERHERMANILNESADLVDASKQGALTARNRFEEDARAEAERHAAEFRERNTRQQAALNQASMDAERARTRFQGIVAESGTQNDDITRRLYQTLAMETVTPRDVESMFNQTNPDQHDALQQLIADRRPEMRAEAARINNVNKASRASAQAAFADRNVEQIRRRTGPIAGHDEIRDALQIAVQRHKDAQSAHILAGQQRQADAHGALAENQAGLKQFHADQAAIETEESKSVEARAESQILEAMRQNPAANHTMRDLATLTQLEPGSSDAPLNSPLNRALVNMVRDGRIVAQDRQFGGPIFSLRPQAESARTPEAAPAATTMDDVSNAIAANRAEQRLAGLRRNLPAKFIIANNEDGKAILVSPNDRTRILPDDPAKQVEVIEAQLRRRGFNPDEVVAGTVPRYRTGKPAAKATPTAAPAPAAEPAAEPAAPQRRGPLTSQQRTALKNIGADFLDDIEPDADGNLIKPVESKAKVIVNEVGARAPLSWDEIPVEQHASIRESYSKEVRKTLRTSASWRVEIRERAKAAINSELDAMNSEQVANAILPMIRQRIGLEKANVEDVKAMLDTGEELAAQTKERWRNNAVSMGLVEKLDGRKAWMRREYAAAVNDRINNATPEQLYRHARDTNKLSSLNAPKTTALLAKFGMKLQDVASVVGALDHWEVTVAPSSYEEDTLSVSIVNSDASMRRSISMKDGKMHLYNSSFFANDNAPKGMGLQVLSQSVAHAQRLGFKEIKTDPCRSSTMVGYHVWPLFGYDAPLSAITSSSVRRLTQEKYPNAQTIRDVYDTPGGREWWTENGESISGAKFYPTPGSRNWVALQNYMKKKKSQRDRVRSSAQPQTA